MSDPQNIPSEAPAPSGVSASRSTLAFLRHWQMPLLAVVYVAGFIVFDRMVDNINRYFIFCNLLIVSSLYFSWSLGGRETMLYVAFFNLFFAFVFARLFAVANLISAQLFTGKSFIVLYLVILVFMVVMLTKESPADIRRRKRDEGIQAERRMRHQLELMVATQKLTDDVIRQANRVKDELLLLQSSWKSQIHSIVNDLSPVKERELYEAVVRPFQDDILRHLRGLEDRLSFNPQPVTLDGLLAVLTGQMENDRAFHASKARITLEDEGWRGCGQKVLADTGKTWEIVLNLIRNSQTAIELHQIDLIRQDPARFKAFQAAIEIRTRVEADQALILVRDTGGGVAPEQLATLFKKPMPSRKRGGKAFGQGTIFVKFFGESMGFRFAASNGEALGFPGLEVAVIIPLLTESQMREFALLAQND